MGGTFRYACPVNCTASRCFLFRCLSYPYLYRAIDADGNLVDSMLSETRDMDAAKRFFARARTVVGHALEKVTTDGHDAYPRAIRETLGPEVQHRTSRYMNNRMDSSFR